MSLWETFSLQTKIASRRPVVLQAIKNVCCDADLIDEVDYDKVPVLIVLGRLLFPPASVLDDLAKAEDRVEEKFRAVVPSVISVRFHRICLFYSLQCSIGTCRPTFK